MGQVIKVGDYAQDNISGIRNISCEADANDFSSVQFPQGTFYKVPSTKTFYICQINFQVSIAQTKIVLGYGDDTVLASVVEPTNPVYLIPQVIVSSAGAILENKLFIPVPADKYIFIGSITGNTVVVIEGVEL